MEYIFQPKMIMGKYGWKNEIPISMSETEIIEMGKWLRNDAAAAAVVVVWVSAEKGNLFK